jgi:hypothetical protein
MPKPPSAYVPLDINFLRDRDIRRAGPDAELLYIRALAYCKGSFSDGFVPEYDLPMIAVDLKNTRRRVEKLVEVGLWIVAEGGWQIRGWSIWNETSQETSEKRARAAARQAAKRARDAESESHDSHETVTRDSQASNSVKEEEEEEELASQRDAERDVTPLPRRDELFERLVAECGIDPDEITKTARGGINNALRQLREVGANPNQVTLRSRRYRERFRDASLTPSALVKHWASLNGADQTPAVFDPLASARPR